MRGRPAPAGARPAGHVIAAAGLAVIIAAFVCDLTLVLLVHDRALAPRLGSAAVSAALIGCFASVAARSVTRAEHRLGWGVAAAGIGCYALASLLWNAWLEYLPHPPNPSVSDFLWKAAYPLVAIAIIGVGRGSARRGARARVTLAVVIAVSATAAITTTCVLPQLHGVHGSYRALVNDFQYPAADTILLLLAASVAGLRNWRLGRHWALVMAALGLLLAADLVWTNEVAHGATTGSNADLLLYIGMCLCAVLAAWQPTHAEVDGIGHPVGMVMPAVFVLIPPALLVYDHFAEVPLVAFILAMVALAGATARIALELHDLLSVGDLRRAAVTDELTGLPNARALSARLRAAAHDREHSLEPDGLSLTLMMLDLDDFKALNDTLGHDVGDELLRMLAPRLRAALGPGDMVTRLSGDEFAILLDQHTPCERTAQAMLDTISRPLRIHGIALRLTASLGVASYPEDAPTPERLLRCAEVAMYEAKRSRRGWQRYAREHDRYTPERLALGGMLADALELGQIEAFFQPIVETASGRITGAEALARWRHPDGSLRMPEEFLEAIELAGLDRRLTRRMLELTLDHAVRMRGWGIRMALNATVADLLDEAFPDEVIDALAARDLTGSSLVIEVTERSVLANPTSVAVVLERLRDAGVLIALDDFGTGYSSLTHLRELPLDAVKVDRSFVAEMHDRGKNAAIVRAMIELGHALGLVIVAEGVEDERTWRALAALGSERIQGFACSRPLDGDAFAELVERWNADHLAASQSAPAPASTASAGSIA